MPKKSEFPEEGEMVVATVKLVKNFGAFVTLDEYNGKEGFIHISEVSSGWVKYIRDFVREGQKIVCKVLAVDPSKGHIDCSLKKVNEHQKRDTIKEWKNEQKAGKIFEIVASRLNKKPEVCYKDFGNDLIDKYGLLFTAFEDALISADNLRQNGFEGDWVEVFSGVAKENIPLPFVTIQGILEVSCFLPDGAKRISAALGSIEKEDENLSVTVQYIGAPRYRIFVKAPDYKLAEDEMKNAVSALESAITKNKGTCQFTRKEG
jgi:translation initiation factor 2 subunit 1